MAELLKIIRQECPNLAERRGALRTRVAPLERLYNGTSRGAYGKGHIAGQGAGLLTVDGKVASRRIIVIDAKTNRIIQQAWSKEDGTYKIDFIDENREYHVIAVDDEREYEPVGWSFIKPCVD